MGENTNINNSGDFVDKRNFLSFTSFYCLNRSWYISLDLVIITSQYFVCRSKGQC